jgi:hypothetical protein
MTTAATCLVIAGIVALLIAQFVSLGQTLDSEGVPVDTRTAVRQPPQSRTVATYDRAPVAPRPPADTYQPSWSHTPVAGQARTPAAAATRPAGWGLGQFVAPDAAPAYAPTPPPAPPSPQASAWPPAPTDPDDIDPWALFSGPAVPPPPRNDR